MLQMTMRGLHKSCKGVHPMWSWGRAAESAEVIVMVGKREPVRTCFFFSSRRRHTRFDCDWSSDVCSSDLIQGGMDWKQAVFTVFLGNCIVLVPMLLNSHPGARYGVPFPVLARASFGVLGANVAAILRAFVACGWFGIQTWIGGEAINVLFATVWPSWSTVPHGAAICFIAFWLINLFVILKGIEYIRFLQGISAPVLIAVGLLLLGWAYLQAGGFGPMLSAPSRFKNSAEFFKFLIPALNATVGFWATISLNIPDFTRFAKNQRAQAIGQALALPTTMTLYAFIGVAVTSATVVIFESAIDRKSVV